MKKTSFISAILVITVFVSLFIMWYGTNSKETSVLENRKLEQMEEENDNEQ